MNRRAFVGILALAVMILVVMTVAVLSTTVGHDMRRTRLAHDEAQARLYLLAGAAERTTLTPPADHDGGVILEADQLTATAGSARRTVALPGN